MERDMATKPYRADIQQLGVIKRQIPPEWNEWSPSLDQEDPPEPLHIKEDPPEPPHIKEDQEDPAEPPHIKEDREDPPVPPHIKEDQEEPPDPPHIKEEQDDPAEPPHIKQEQEELWTSQEGEQHQGLEEADTTKFLFTPVPVKSEEDGEKPQSSQLHQRQTEQMETEADAEDWGGPQPDRNLDPDTHFQPETEEINYYSTETRETETGPNSLKTAEVSESDQRCDNNGGKIFSCSECGQILSCNRNLKRHMAKVCGKRSKEMGDVTKHMVFHMGEKMFTCPDCEKRFSTVTKLKLHMRIHTGEKPFCCLVCSQRFARRGNLSAHMVVHTGEKSFSCSDCGKMFRRTAHLKRHMDTHTGDRPFFCPECGKRFIRKTHLTQHMFTHVEEKSFSCSECGKRFGMNGDLKRHMAIHTGDKPFSCSFCSKRFKVERYVTQHMAVHIGEKNFSCSVCGKMYPYKVSLKRHMAVHTGEKPYGCSICEQRFTYDKQLKRHKCAGLQSSQLHQNHTEENIEAEQRADGSIEQLNLQIKEKFCTSQDVPPEQHEWSPSLAQEPPHVKEEQEELWTSQEGEQHQGLEEADTTKLLFTPVPVKSEEDGEKPQSSQLHQRQTEQKTGAVAMDWVGPQPVTNLSPDIHLQPKAEESSETEDSDDYSKETREPQPGFTLMYT